MRKILITPLRVGAGRSERPVGPYEGVWYGGIDNGPGGTEWGDDAIFSALSKLLGTAAAELSPEVGAR